MASLSLIVVSHNEGANLHATVNQLRATIPPDTEIIVVDDQSTDGSADFLDGPSGGARLVRGSERLGAPRARNVGAAQAHGEVLVFSDAHVDPEAAWVEAFLDVLSRPEVGAVNPVMSVMGNPGSRGFGLTWKGPGLDVEWLPRRGNEPYRVPLLGAGFLGIRRKVFDAVGGWDGGRVLWGGADSELSLRLWLLGYECWVQPRVTVAHLFRHDFPYAVDQVTVLRNLLRTAAVHFDVANMARTFDHHRRDSVFSAAVAALADSDTAVLRADLLGRRVRDDTSFLVEFGVHGFH